MMFLLNNVYFQGVCREAINTNNECVYIISWCGKCCTLVTVHAVILYITLLRLGVNFSDIV